jgi:hypothetical protein
MKLNSTLLLALVGCVTAIGSPMSPLTASPRNVFGGGGKATKTVHAALAVRGGAGPIDPKAMAKWSTGAVLVNASYTYLLPGKVRELYNAPYDPLTDLIMQRHGAAQLSFTLMSYCLFFQETSVETAVGVSTLPFIIDFCRWGEKPYMYREHFALVPVATGAAICCGCFYSKDWANIVMQVGPMANIVMQVYTVYGGISGLLAILSPDLHAKARGLRTELTGIQKLATQWWGLFVLELGVCIGCLAAGVEPIKAVGYAWLPETLANAYWNVLTYTTKDLGLNRPMLFAWMVLGMAVTATLSFD